VQPAFVHHPDYDFELPRTAEGDDLGRLHLFDGRRASRAWELALARDPAIEGARLEPEAVSVTELLRVHSRDYLASLESSAALAEVIESPRAAELDFEPLWRAVAGPQLLATGGTLLALRHALEGGVAINLSGGYHHAHRGRGGGFCLFNDIALTAVVARREHGLARVLVVDLDVHQGDGTSSILAEEEGVAILDVYNADVFPGDAAARRGLRWDLPVHTGTSGAAYLELVERELPRALDDFDPQLVLFNAGTDVVAGDPLGSLAVEPEAVERRDELVLAETRRRGIATVVTASGGYTELSHRLLAATVGGLWARAQESPAG